MKLTTQELEQMRSVDIGAVAAESLPDVSGMTFDNALSRKERISRFLQTVKNPYCFCIGGVGVKIEFAESGPSLQAAKKRAVTSVTARFASSRQSVPKWRHPCCPPRTEL